MKTIILISKRDIKAYLDDFLSTEKSLPESWDGEIHEIGTPATERHEWIIRLFKALDSMRLAELDYSIRKFDWANNSKGRSYANYRIAYFNKRRIARFYSRYERLPESFICTYHHKSRIS